MYPIIQKFAKENANIQLYINEHNLGYRSNFKKAISLTRGEYIFLCDQDDEWHPDKIETLVRLMNEKGCEAICTDYQLIDEQSQVLNKENFHIHPFIRKAAPETFTEIRFHDLIFGNIAQGCTYCFNKSVKEGYLQLENEDVVHDQQIMFIASLYGKVLFYKHALIDYRIHSDNAIGLASKKNQVAFDLKKPSRKPFMVRFLDELEKLAKIPHKPYYIALFYLRIPFLVSKFRNR